MNPEVLIAGGGPTGLTLAIDLARRGVPIRAVDKAGQYFHGSRGDGIQPRTLEVFDDLGVLDAVLAAGDHQAPMRAYLGDEVIELGRMTELKAPTPDLPHPNPWVLGQARIEGILRDRLAEFGVRVELSTELVDFRHDETGVEVTLLHDGERESLRVDYLVGADGGRSFVRKGLGIAFEGTTDDSIHMLLADASIDGLDHQYGHVFSHGGDPKAGVFLSPLPGGDQFQIAAPRTDGQASASLDGLQALLDRYSGRTDLRVRDLTWATEWRPNIRLARRFRAGRVLIAGDAAHVHPPTGGQGLNTGVQDAYNLGWKLAATLSGADLLDTYEQERRTVAATVLGLTSRLLEKYVDGAEDAFKRDETTHQTGINYRGGPLASDDRDRPGRLRSGDRAPDAPVSDANGKRIRLFDLFRGPHATVLAFGDGDAAAEDGVPVYRISPSAGAGDLVDTEGHAFAAYDPGAGARFLIRPDGYVGRITN